LATGDPAGECLASYAEEPDLETGVTILLDEERGIEARLVKIDSLNNIMNE
jgi:hypothetical protein